jgi:acetyl/propionyl-CoA carboxylase alpha subunit
MPFCKMRIFIKGDFDTHFLDKKFKYEGEKYPQETLDVLTAALQMHRFEERAGKLEIASEVPAGWRNNPYRPQVEKYSFGGFEFPVEYTNKNGNLTISFAEKTFEVKAVNSDKTDCIFTTYEINGVRRKFHFSQNGNQYFVHSPALGQIVLLSVNPFPNVGEEALAGGYASPMPGEITSVLVKAGDKVKSGDPLIKMISMKMETTIEAHEDAEVEEVFVTDKQFVEAGTLLIKMKE